MARVGGQGAVLAPQAVSWAGHRDANDQRTWGGGGQARRPSVPTHPRLALLREPGHGRRPSTPCQEREGHAGPWRSGPGRTSVPSWKLGGVPPLELWQPWAPSVARSQLCPHSSHTTPAPLGSPAHSYPIPTPPLGLQLGPRKEGPHGLDARPGGALRGLMGRENPAPCTGPGASGRD